ncbi:MAG: transcriptional repressor [Acidobacteria bacterium]|nr:transcriptional repressor [Acidobacteriota bacterium]
MLMRKMKEEKEVFHSYLRQNGLKKTYQKDLILETFLNTEGHLSVEDVYALVKKRDKKVGVVTVFRTLKSLMACGIAREISLGDGLTRFEHNYHHPAHHHIICTECRKVIEFVCPELEKIQEEIVHGYHFQPIRHRFQTYGICEDCREHRAAAEIQRQDTGRIFARDAAKVAICMENRCLEFYKDAATRNPDAEGNEFLKQMILEGKKHLEDLNAQLAEIVSRENDLERAPVFLHFDPRDLNALIPDISKYEAPDGSRLDTQACMDLALSLNRKTKEFFEEYAERFAETQGKQILLEFAGHKGLHGELIRRHLEGMKRDPGIG